MSNINQYIEIMAKKTKTWKIGEYAKGGIITVETKGNKVSIINKQWDFSKGTRRSSNQTNADVLDRREYDCDSSSPERDISNFLHELTTSYYSDEILKWIESKVDIKRSMFW